MKKHLISDKKKRKLTLKYENKRIILKSILKNSNLFKTTRWNASLLLTDLCYNNITKTRLVNRCILTGRKGKFRQSYRFSRLIFLNLARNGLINGIRKSTW
jgi:small subunit ribosomal protein S14